MYIAVTWRHQAPLTVGRVRCLTRPTAVNACVVEYGVSFMLCYVAQCYIVAVLTDVFDLSHTVMYV